MTVTLTRLPHLNDTIVIKQRGEHFFIAAPDSIVIDKDGLLILLAELVKIGFIDMQDLLAADFRAKKDLERDENKENISNTNIG